MFESRERRALRAAWLVWFAVIGATTLAWTSNAFGAAGTPSPVPLRVLWASPTAAVLLAVWWRGVRGTLVAALAVAAGAFVHVSTTSSTAFSRPEWFCIVGVPLGCAAVAGAWLRWEQVDLRRPGVTDAGRFVACSLVTAVLAAGATVGLLAQFGHAPADPVRSLFEIAVPELAAIVVTSPVAFLLRAARARQRELPPSPSSPRSLAATAPRVAAVLGVALLVTTASLGGPRLDLVVGSVLLLALAALAEERRRSEEAARRAVADLALDRARVRVVLDHAPDGVLVLDALGRVECANRGASRIFGAAPEALVGRSLRELVPVPDGIDPARHIVELLGAGRDPVAAATRQAQGVDGRVFPVELSVSRVDIDDRWGYVVTVRDDADLRRLDQQLAHRGTRSAGMAVVDRPAFRSQVAIALHEMRRRPTGVAVLLVGIDRGAADRRHGVDTGERLVHEAARRLRAQARRTDVVARVGPDRLALLVWPCADAATAEAAAARVQAELARPSSDVPDATASTCRVGIVTTWDPDASPDRLVRDAELALARAWRDPAGAPCHYQTTVDIRSATSAVPIDLRDQLSDDRITLRYQPILDLATGRVTSIEALARLRRPDGSLVQPSDFVPATERAGLIARLGAIVLPRAAHDLANLREQEGAEDLQVAVNVSPLQLDEGLCRLVDDALAATQLAPRALVLEVTESAPVDAVPGAADILRQLQARGVGIALDDFGTGFTRPDLVRDLPIDAIKIDRSFVQSIVESDVDRDIVGAIVTLARRRNLTVIAEGVESVEQAHLLARLGCTHAQGFLFGHPVDVDELAYLLREWHIVPAIATNLVRTR